MTWYELGTLAAAEKIIANAPVRASRSTAINTSVEEVWRILTAVSNWEV